jgi:crotonobetainyl-CoA:carnitine CoA-transferase CaiB-like acyl-CoA transferase
MTALPLAGLRVVDMADVKGELCGRFLADLGAEVIRVEPPRPGERPRGGCRPSMARRASPSPSATRTSAA